MSVDKGNPLTRITAYSREKAFKRWIKKLKNRQKIMENTGYKPLADDIGRKIQKELKNHGS